MGAETAIPVFLSNHFLFRLCCGIFSKMIIYRSALFQYNSREMRTLELTSIGVSFGFTSNASFTVTTTMSIVNATRLLSVSL